ncbi:MAG: hypothetical protein JSV88_33055 [Candidatus Aminicenantes bacterium]|nr:MAG: hypothetical protein JSV88_33055 [Candidatus Aminicenantes bacterium]
MRIKASYHQERLWFIHWFEYEALRTRMITVEEELFQQVEPEIELNVQVLDLTTGSGSFPGTSRKKPGKTRTSLSTSWHWN